MKCLEDEIKKLIVDTLKLEDISADEIDSDEPLFVEGLGLDSIDALELGVALRRAYGITLESVNEELKAHFADVRSLARYVASRRNRVA